MTTTVLDVVRLSTRFLSDRGSPSARLDAELLAAHGLGLRRLDLYLQHDRPLDDTELAPLRELLRRRAAGEPVAYLVGAREFWGRSFAVGPAVLVPRPETETLVERVLLWARQAPGGQGEGLLLSDVGTGSGCIAITLAAELPGARVIAVDISPAALEVAHANAVATAVADRVEFVLGDFLDPLAGRDGVDAVIANPPYIPSGEIDSLAADVRDFEPRRALDGGADGLDAYRAITPGVAEVVRPGGLVALEIDHRGAAAVSALVVAALPGSAVTVTADLAGHERVVEAQRPW